MCAKQHELFSEGEEFDLFVSFENIVNSFF